MRAALSTAELNALNRHAPVNGLAQWFTDRDTTAAKRYIFNGGTAPIAASTTNILAATTCANGSTTTLTTFLAQPDFARNIQVTVALGGGNPLAGDVVITGTDINGQALTETIAVTTAATYQSTKAFKTISSIVIPARAQASDTVAVGVGAKFGLPEIFFGDTILRSAVSGASDTYTLTANSTEVAKNLFAPNLAPNASRTYRLYYLQERD